MRLNVKRNDKIGMFFFFAFVISSSLIWFFEERFNPEQWRKQRVTRYKMADDIIDSQLLIGKTLEEVQGLLGEGERSTLKGSPQLVYALGTPPSFFKPKKEKLIVVFENNRVVKVIHFLE